MTAETDLEVAAAGEVVPAPDASSTPLSLLQQAVSQGADPDTLEKLLDLQERMMAKQGESDFYAALSELQYSLDPVRHDAKSHQATYATMTAVADHIREAMHDHGFSYSFDSQWSDDGHITVICIIRHRGGHSERTTFTAPMDKQARMNDSQKAGSALSYAKRYALQAALGLTTSNERDDDGNAAGTEMLNDEQAANIAALRDELPAKRQAAFDKWRGTFAESAADIPASRYAEVIHNLEVARAKA